MTLIDRRGMLRSLCGGVVVAAAASTVAAHLMPGAAEAAPVVFDDLPRKRDGLVREAQAIVVGPRHRHPHMPRRRPRRRWVCWWHRGRRICGWRWR